MEPLRLNKFIAQSTAHSRRGADSLIANGRVMVNDVPAEAGQTVTSKDTVTIDGKTLAKKNPIITILLNKPRGYVCSRDGQGSQTIYELLPEDLQILNPVGRLDKESSGLLLMTTDGQLAYELSHPSFAKVKRYIVTFSRPLEPIHQQMINDRGIMLSDGVSQLTLTKKDEAGKEFEVTMSEGRNRQIRRTFAALGYQVGSLHRTDFGPYHLGDVATGQYVLL